MAEKKFALDIHSLLSRLDKGDLHVYETLSEEEKKGLSPFILSQWMFGTNNKLQVILLNELVNPYVFSLTKNHTELLVKLMACCGVKAGRRFSWVPMPKSSKKEPKLALQVVMEAYEFSEREARGNMHLLSNEDVLLLAEEELGWEKAEIAKLKKELK